MSDRNSIQFLLEQPIAHRGLHDAKSGIPENSLPAFSAAIKKKYPIELDVRLLNDGQVVVFHDDNLKRMTGKSAELKDLTLSELPKLKNTDYRIPTLQEVLNLVRGQVPLLIELKTNNDEIKLEEATLKILRQYSGKVAIQSFNPHVLRFFRKNAPKIPRGQLASPTTRADSENLRNYLSQKYPYNFTTKPDFIAYNAAHIHHPGAHHKNTPTLAWTIRSEKELKKVSPYCDNIIFEGF